MKKRRMRPNETPDTSRNNLRRLPRRIRSSRAIYYLSSSVPMQAQLQFSQLLLKNREIYCPSNIQILYDSSSKKDSPRNAFSYTPRSNKRNSIFTNNGETVRVNHRHGQGRRCEARKGSTKRRRTGVRRRVDARGAEDKEGQSGRVTSAWHGRQAPIRSS